VIGYEYDCSRMTSALAASGGLNGDIRFHNLSNSNCVHVIDGGDYNHALCHINKLVTKGTTLAVAGHSWIRIHSLGKPDSPASIMEGGHTHNVTSIAFQADEKWLVSSGEDGKIRIWDLRARGFQLGISHTCAINSATVHPNQGVIVFGDQEGYINHFDIAANSVMRHKVGEGTGLGVLTVAYDDHNRLICSHDNRYVSLYSDPEIGNRTEFNNDDCELDFPDDASPRHALMPPRMIPLISRSVSAPSHNRSSAGGVHRVTNLIAPPQRYHQFAHDVHQHGYISNISLSGPESLRHQALIVSSSDGSLSVWRTSHDDNLYSLDAHIGSGSRTWCSDAKFIDERTRFILSAYADGKCRVWDTVRPSITPLSIFDGGCGKSIRSISVLNPDNVDFSDRRIR
jgi:WD40 repeat protein